MKLQHKLLLAILILTLALGLTTTVWAANSEARGRLLRGKVTATTDDSLTMQPCRAKVTLLTDEETAFDVPDIENAALADIAVGDRIGAAGRWNEDGSLQARAVGKPRQRG